MKKNELNIQSIMMKKLNGEQINWYHVSLNLHKTNIDFIDEFHSEFYWNVAFEKPLSEKILMHTIQYIEDNCYVWDDISQYQKLSISFMDLYYQKLNKEYLVKFQKLEEEFILKHYSDFNPVELLMYQDLTEGVIQLIGEDVHNIQSILEYKKMYNEILYLIQNAKGRVSKVGYDTYLYLRDGMQREAIKKFKTVLRRMK